MAYIVAVVKEDRFFHRTFALIPFFMLITLRLVPMLNKLGTSSAGGANCLRNFGWFRLGSTCARYLSYWEKLRERDLALGLGGKLGLLEVRSSVGEEGCELRTVSAVSFEPVEVFLAWLEKAVVSESAPLLLVAVEMAGGIEMPNVVACCISSSSISSSDAWSPGRRTSAR